jgi:Putative glycosyl/glycerophosphate transferases involved in teichoic acid biosynthesis TagF/TagB/EpsJ/RodC
MNALKKVFKRLLIFFENIFVFLFSLFVPKSKKIVVIGGWFGERFCDNSKALFLLLNRDKRFEKIVWISRSRAIVRQVQNEGFVACYYRSFKSFWYHLRAGTHIVDQGEGDIVPALSVRAKKINLYHGLPIKKVGVDCDSHVSKAYLAFKKISIFSPGFWGNCYFLSPSDYVDAKFSRAFLLKKRHLIRASYPRDYFVSCEHEENGFRPSGSDKIVFYFPTFRSKSDGKFDQASFFEKLDGFGLKNHVTFITKFHFADSENNSFGHFKKIIFLDKTFDINEILWRGDVLITDYSSVCWDFMLLHRPVVFFPFDFLEYKTADRGFYEDYPSFVPGEIAYNTNDLLSLLERVVSNPEGYMKENEPKYSDTLNKMNCMSKAFSIEPLIQFVLK